MFYMSKNLEARKTRTPEQKYPEMVEHAYKKVWYELNKMDVI